MSLVETDMLPPRYVLATKEPAEKERWLNAFLQERADAEKAMLSGTSLVNNAVDEDEDTCKP